MIGKTIFAGALLAALDHAREEDFSTLVDARDVPARLVSRPVTPQDGPALATPRRGGTARRPAGAVVAAWC